MISLSYEKNISEYYLISSVTVIIKYQCNEVFLYKFVDFNLVEKIQPTHFTLRIRYLNKLLGFWPVTYYNVFWTVPNKNNGSGAFRWDRRVSSQIMCLKKDYRALT